VRVLTVGNMYPPQHLGGYELVWRSAVEHLRSGGHEVRVLTTREDLGTEAPDDPDVYRELRWYWRDYAFPRLSVRERVRLERHNADALEQHLDALRPDVVSWWAMGGMSLSLLERVRRRGLPAVAFVHDDWLAYGPRVDGWLKLGRRIPGMSRLLERATGLPARVDFGTAGRYVFVSEATRRRAREVGHDLPDTGVAHSGIDTRFLDRRAPEQAWGWRLLYVGRLDERKGVDTAVDALALLPADTTLTIVGSGDPSERPRLERHAEAAGVADRVVFAGSRDSDGLAAAYAAADVVVFPVRWDEPWGLVPLESMAVGRPVVATGRGGSAEYLRDGDNALLFEAGDATGLAAAVRRLATDEALRARLREAGLATAPLHTDAIFNAAVERELAGASARGGRHTPAR
jgi:glycosyltransferase involved in cell wall biosynthesis